MRFGGIEHTISNMFNHIEFGDIDWVFLTKFFELED